MLDKKFFRGDSKKYNKEHRKIKVQESQLLTYPLSLLNFFYSYKLFGMFCDILCHLKRKILLVFDKEVVEVVKIREPFEQSHKLLVVAFDLNLLAMFYKQRVCFTDKSPQLQESPCL